MITFLRNASFAIIFFFILSIPNAIAQSSFTPDTIKYWSYGGLGTVNFSQVSLNNWAAGGHNSVSVLGVAGLYANYKHGANTWNNSLDFTYGLVKLENQRVQKSDDKLEMNLKYGHRATKKWFYSAQLNLKTQLTPTYNLTRDTIISNFFSPAFVLASIGMDYKPNEKLSIFLSPFTGKFTFVQNQVLADKGAFGLPGADLNSFGKIIPGTGDLIRREFGGYVNVRYKNEILRNIIYQSKLDLFSNYLNSPDNIDVNWENSLNFKVNKVISANLFVHMIYDDDINVPIDTNNDNKFDAKGPRLQFKETLGIGISYSFK
jgi:hypothetical protein